MFTDMVGYTALGQKNESLSLALLEEQKKLIRPIIGRHGGREVKTIGDAFLVEFPNAVDAVRCAYDIQRAAREFNLSLRSDKRIHLRIGLHLGEVVEEAGDIFGDAVNVASRVEALAEDGGVSLTRQVYDHVYNKLDLQLKGLGMVRLKNIGNPMEVYKIVLPWAEEGAASTALFDKRRVAVLPFTNMSPVKEDEYFADGLTEELISTMSRIGGLKVIARTSVMGYKGGQKKIGEIAKELEVGAILEGSVRKSGDKARITVQLIDPGTSEHLWAESYDRDIKDVFAIQSDISKTVAQALKVQLTSQEKAAVGKEQTSSPEAYTLYLKGRFYWNERTQDNIKRALKYFGQAVAIDPAFALAYSGLADCYNILADYGWMDPAIAGTKAREYSLDALRVDKDLAEAHASLGLTFLREWDFVGAERELRRAIELRPNYAPAFHWLSVLLFEIGKVEESFDREREAADLDPYSPVIGMGLGSALYEMGQFEDSIMQYGRVIESNPGFAAVHSWKCYPHIMLSQNEAAVREATIAFELDNVLTYEFNLAWCHAMTGNTAEAQRVMEHAESRARSEYYFFSSKGLALIALGRLDEGFELLGKGLAEKEPTLRALAVDPWFKKYRSDPRWKQLGDAMETPPVSDKTVAEK